MLSKIYAWFETRIPAFPDTPPVRPPDTLPAFYWHYLQPIWPILIVLLAVGFAGSVIEVALMAWVGSLVDWMRAAQSPDAFFAEHKWKLIGMGFTALVLRPLLSTLHDLIKNQMIAPALSTRLRWQMHRYVLRQSLSFFQNDFAGRIANHVMQTGGALRMSAIAIARPHDVDGDLLSDLDARPLLVGDLFHFLRGDHAFVVIARERHRDGVEGERAVRFPFQRNARDVLRIGGLHAHDHGRVRIGQHGRVRERTEDRTGVRDVAAVLRAGRAGVGGNREDRLAREAVKIQSRIQSWGTADPPRAKADGVSVRGVDRDVAPAVFQRGFAVIVHVLGCAGRDDFEHFVSR